ncbi:MAG: sigma-70 family RNA polymerase sigma factor [Planctomycetota bacterium]
MTALGSKTLRTQEERDRLVEMFLPLVRYVVARLPVTMPGALDRDDLFSVGVMGLMHAATTYDAARGASFKTFAYTAIRGAILDEVRKLDPVPRQRRDRLRKLNRAQAELAARLDREPTMLELADALQCSEQEIDEDLQALHTARTLSLDDGRGGDDDGEGEGGGATLGSLLGADDTVDPGDAATHRERLHLLAKAISELPETDRHVVVLYFHEQVFLKEIGQILGVTESRVSQILTRATERLRLKLREQE